MNKHAVADFETLTTSDVKGLETGFSVGTKVRTEHGERSVETVSVGDRMITSNGKLTEVVSVSTAFPHTSSNPVMIEKDALGTGLPRRDVMLAPDQSILITDPVLEQLFDCTSAVVSARDLVGIKGITEVTNITPMAYVHVACNAPEVLFCSGLACLSDISDVHFERAPKLGAAMVKAYAAQI